jgi:hypothetical protein
MNFVYFRIAKIICEVLEPIRWQQLCKKICNVSIVFLNFVMKAKSTNIDSSFWLVKSIPIAMTNSRLR